MLKNNLIANFLKERFMDDSSLEQWQTRCFVDTSIRMLTSLLSVYILLPQVLFKDTVYISAVQINQSKSDLNYGILLVFLSLFCDICLFFTLCCYYLYCKQSEKQRFVLEPFLVIFYYETTMTWNFSFIWFLILAIVIGFQL